MKFHTLLRAAQTALAFSLAASVQAAYPDKPVKLIVPYVAGSPADNVARTLGEGPAKRLKQPVFAAMAMTPEGGERQVLANTVQASRTKWARTISEKKIQLQQ